MSKQDKKSEKKAAAELLVERTVEQKEEDLEEESDAEEELYSWRKSRDVTMVSGELDHGLASTRYRHFRHCTTLSIINHHTCLVTTDTNVTHSCVNVGTV